MFSIPDFLQFVRSDFLTGRDRPEGHVISLREPELEILDFATRGPEANRGFWAIREI